MKLPRFALLAVAALSISICAQTTEQPAADAEKVKIKLTLDDFRQMALKDNPSLAVAKARVDAAMAGVRQAQAAYYPTVNLESTAQHSRDRTIRTTGAYSSRMNYDVTLSSTWVLFDGFQRRFNLLNAKYDRENAEESERNARRLLMQAISQAFYSALNFQNHMVIAKEDADYNSMLLDDAQKRHDSGVAKQSEVLNFILQVKNAEVNYVTAEQNWRTGMIALAALAAIDFNSLPSNVWDYYELVEPNDANKEMPPFDTLLAQAKENRPDLKAAEAKIIIAKEGMDAAKGTFLPSITLYTNYGFNKDKNTRFSDSYDRVINGGIRLNWTLFNGFKTPAQIAQGRATLASAFKERDNLLIEIESSLRQNLLVLATSRKQFQYQEEILKTAKEIRDLVHQEYLGGTTTITRLNEAQTAVTKAASERSSAFIQVLNNLENIKAITAQNIE